MQKIKLEREMKITHDCGGEFTLPDYVPAIGRMLSATCTPSPEGIYIKEADARGVEAELGGTATFRILYISEDGGGVCGYTVPCDYDANVVIGQVGGAAVCRSSTVPENVFCRVTAPRKLQLRCRLGSRLTVLSASDGASDDFSASDLELKTGTVEAMSVSSASARDLLVSSDLSGLPEGAVPIICTASATVSDCKAVSAGEYRCRGDITIECLYAVGGETGVVRDRIGFDETLTSDGDDADETVEPRAFARITSVELHHDDSGSRAEVVYMLEAETAEPVSADVVYDAYSVKAPVEVEYDDMEYLSPIAAHFGTFSVNEHVPKNVSGRVPFVSACAEMTGSSVERGRLKLSGELRGNAVAVSGGEYETVQFCVPWTYEIPASSVGGDEEPVVWGDVSVASISARADGELAVDAEIAVSVTAAAQKRERVLSSVRQDGEPFPPKNGFTVYYPTKTDEVWDIAKRFHVPASAVTAEGNVTPDGTPARVVVI